MLRDERLSGIRRRRRDSRSEFRRDRDRLLYSQAFQRLGGITQVVAPQEGQSLHNRLIHSLKVGQVSRGLAENLSTRYPAARLHLDADVAEFAGMAHDLGHPPFGHAAEDELQRIMSKFGTDSFEGNAQTFRIVTRLARQHDGAEVGLDATRASLCAILKYPWFRITDDLKATRKWGVYQGDEAAFRWCYGETFVDQRVAAGGPLPIGTLESQVMDWADDITYAVHDIEDFTRIGIIPLADLLLGDEAWQKFSAWMTSKWAKLGLSDAERSLEAAWDELSRRLPAASYGNPEGRDFLLSLFVSKVVHKCIIKTKLKKTDGGWELVRPTRLHRAIKALKEVVWYFVIDGPRLRSSQAGQRKITSTLFEYFHAEALNFAQGYSHVNLPSSTRWSAVMLRKRSMPIDAPRVACDALCEMNELQAFRLYRRITGIKMGQVDLFDGNQDAGWLRQ